MIVGKNLSMNLAMRHITLNEGNTASYKMTDGDVWEFRINSKDEVMECREEKVSQEWRPVNTIFASIDTTDHGWTLHVRVDLMWGDKLVVEDYRPEKFEEALDKMMWEGWNWDECMVEWLTSGKEESLAARQEALVDIFLEEYKVPVAVVFRHFLDYLLAGGTPDLDCCPLNFKGVA